ncbi:MAG: ATP-binding cassette domain-containing protein [Candidatus Aminicenantes bacterium]|nr:ATP-binding cassette domain-containing protein [Candidatus Aminicenantes bacterium]NIM80958.1 ATP-binding cassette domain-containing protein [Candidatus Aminicenantes bacterium]NIN20340.1 ATP-binding cassette domain-containing protein [Candidatus Aminicenantes bacterium]NIN44115.1 ATP-binding cassette domain-containing protein [Candidatus Aminicenantes bacterium]NIN86928.1 ATP-binding cassette domain-containing protein [Candidatus Aminicenantes bacterium]
MNNTHDTHDIYSVVAKDIVKYYKKYSHKHKFLTLKSALVNRTLFSALKQDEKFAALKGVSFKVEEGKTLSVIGENGSGKSTLLKILAGISKPTSGEVITKGRISALIELGAGFHPEISGRENIFINGIILGLTKKKIQEKLDDIVKFAELEDFIDNPVKSYSSGMYMRLGFSIAINVDPDILLIDEVLAVGDASFVPKCLDKINEFKRKGKTIVFVSHDLSTVERISDEVIWLKEGKIEMRGYPKRVSDAYMEYIGKRDEKKAEIQHQEEEEEGEDNREKRWGSKEIEINNVRMMDRTGKEKYIFESDESFAIEFDVFAREPEEDFVFGIGIYNSEGIQCYGTNTFIEDYKSKRISGRGKVKVHAPELNLVNGTYFLDVAVHKRDGYPFDYHHFQYTFKVTSTHKDVGVVRIPHQWEFSHNIKLEKPQD